MILSQSPLVAVATVLLASAAWAGEPIKNYGAGTAGSGGHVPTLWANTTPRPGVSSFALEIGRGLGGATGLAIVSTTRANQNIFGLRVLIGLSTSLTLPGFRLSGTGAGNGTASLSLPLPNLPVLIGNTFRLQAFVVDPSGPWIGLSASPGLELTPERPGLLIATRSVAGTADAQSAVDLATGRLVDFSGSRVDNGNGAALTSDGSRLIMTSSLSKKYLAVYDSTKFPPRYLSTIPLNSATTAWTITVTPPGLRAYVVNQGPSTSKPMIDVLWATPGANFGKPFPGGGINPGTNSGVRIVFAPDGNTGFFVSLFGSTLTRYDTKLGSATYHKPTGSGSIVGGFPFDVQIGREGKRVYVPGGSLGSFQQINVFDAVTMKRIDWDPGTSGVQNIGGEKSTKATPFGRVIPSIAVGPRNRFLYVSVTGSAFNPARLVQVNIDPQSPNYRKFVVYTTGLASRAALWGTAVSAAGDLVYLAVRSAGVVHEIDTKTMRQKRVLRVHSSPGELMLR